MGDKGGSSGIGFFSVLTIIFIVLKLTNVIAWSWWWVLAPTWISVVIVLLILLVVFIIARWQNRFLR